MAGSKPKTAGDDEQADDGGAGAAAVESELTQERLIAAIRTLVAMGSCWLDRDPVQTGPDEKQRGRLIEIVELLETASEKQREHAEGVSATMFRDAVAVRMGSAARELPEGDSIIVERHKRAARGDGFVVRDYNVSLKGLFGSRLPRTAVDDVAEALRFGHSHWVKSCGGSPVWPFARRTHSLAFSRKLARDALDGLASKKFKGPQEAATFAVGELVGYDQSEDPRVQHGAARLEADAIDGQHFGESLEQVAERRAFERAKQKFRTFVSARRETSMAGNVPNPDTGTYFGARSFRRRPQDGRAKVIPRAWSGAQLVAAACDGGQNLADAIFDERGDSVHGWHVWRSAAHGYSLRPSTESDSDAIRHCMEELRRGRDPDWPDRSSAFVMIFMRIGWRSWSGEHNAAIADIARGCYYRVKRELERLPVESALDVEGAVAVFRSSLEAIVCTDAPHPVALWHASRDAANAKLLELCAANLQEWSLASVAFAVEVRALYSDSPGRWRKELAEVNRIMCKREIDKILQGSWPTV